MCGGFWKAFARSKLLSLHEYAYEHLMVLGVGGRASCVGDNTVGEESHELFELQFEHPLPGAIPRSRSSWYPSPIWDISDAWLLRLKKNLIWTPINNAWQHEAPSGTTR